MFVSRVLQQLRKSVNPLHFLDVVGDAQLQKAAGKGRTVNVLIEPVNIWRDIQGHNLLELMYRDPKRWSLAFQTYVQLTMMQLHLAPVQTPVKLMERSLQSARYVFVENLHRSGHMTSVELSILDQWFSWITKNEAVGLDMIIYLRTNPQVAMSRILERKRPEEADFPFDWLCRVHDLHEQWLLGRSQFPLPPKVMVVDANKDCTDIQQEFAQHLPGILDRSQLCHAPLANGPSSN